MKIEHFSKFLKEVARYEHELAELHKEHATNLDALVKEIRDKQDKSNGREGGLPSGYQGRQLRRSLNRVAGLVGDAELARLTR